MTVSVEDASLGTNGNTKTYTMKADGILYGYIYANAYQEDDGIKHDFGQLYLRAYIYNSNGEKLYTIVDTSGRGQYQTATFAYNLSEGDYISVYTQEGGINTPAHINGGFSGSAILYK